MVRKICSKLSNIQSGHLSELFENKNVILSQRQPKNVFWLLNWARFNTEINNFGQQNRLFECVNKRYKICSLCIVDGHSLIMSYNMRWELQSHVTCRSINIIYCVCVKRITLCNCLCCSSSPCSRFSASLVRNIGEFGAKKNILRTIEQPIQYRVLDSHLQSLKYMAVNRIRKNLSNFPFLSKRYRAITVCWSEKTHFKQFLNVFILYILTQIVW